MAAALIFQRIGPGFASPELKALAALARLYVFSAVSCLLPLSASAGGDRGEREAGSTGIAGDELESQLDCTAHVTCIGIPRREYFEALRGGDPTAVRNLPAGLPTIVVEGAGLTHPLLGPHGDYIGSTRATELAGPSVICDRAHREWIHGALKRLRATGIKCKTVSTEFSMPDATRPYYKVSGFVTFHLVPDLL